MYALWLAIVSVWKSHEICASLELPDVRTLYVTISKLLFFISPLKSTNTPVFISSVALSEREREQN